MVNIKMQRYSEQFLTETRNGLRKGRSFTDTLFCLKSLNEKKKKSIKFGNTCCLLNMKKAFNSIQGQILLDILNSRNISDT